MRCITPGEKRCARAEGLLIHSVARTSGSARGEALNAGDPAPRCGTPPTSGHVLSSLPKAASLKFSCVKEDVIDAHVITKKCLSFKALDGAVGVRHTPCGGPDPPTFSPIVADG
jgi:hypothetical protein